MWWSLFFVIVFWFLLHSIQCHRKVNFCSVNSTYLTLSRRRPLSNRNQSIDLLGKSMDWFLYNNSLHLKRAKSKDFHLQCKFSCIFLLTLQRVVVLSFRICCCQYFLSSSMKYVRKISEKLSFLAPWYTCTRHVRTKWVIPCLFVFVLLYFGRYVLLLIWKQILKCFLYFIWS